MKNWLIILLVILITLLLAVAVMFIYAIKNPTLTPDECIKLGGRTVNIVGGESCSANEENLGEVVGFISPNICCK